ELSTDFGHRLPLAFGRAQHAPRRCVFELVASLHHPWRHARRPGPAGRRHPLLTAAARLLSAPARHDEWSSGRTFTERALARCTEIRSNLQPDPEHYPLCTGRHVVLEASTAVRPKR